MSQPLLGEAPRRVSRMALWDFGLPRPMAERRLARGVLMTLLGGMLILPDVLFATSAEPVTGLIQSLERDGLPEALHTLVPPWAVQLALDGESSTVAVSDDLAAELSVSGPIEVLRFGDTIRHEEALFSPALLVPTGLCWLLAALSLGQLMGQIARNGWLVQLYRNGVEAQGEVAEGTIERVFARQKPMGRRYELRYHFKVEAGSREGRVSQTVLPHYLPLGTGERISVVYNPDDPSQNLPAAMLRRPVAPRS